MNTFVAQLSSGESDRSVHGTERKQTSAAEPVRSGLVCSGDFGKDGAGDLLIGLGLVGRGRFEEGENLINSLVG